MFRDAICSSISSATSIETGGGSVARKTPREEAARWEIWPGPARGYIALENDLPVIADALEALWLLRARQREIEALLAATAYRVVPAPQPRGGGSRA
jgi:hypothetical protein